MSDRKILTLDIETKPALVWTFSQKPNWIGPDQVKEPDGMICWAAKWEHKNSVLYRSEYHHDKERMLHKLHDLMDEADAIVTYNGDNFDFPHIYREFELASIPDPSPYISVDLYKVLKKKERWFSHKLAFITEQLQLTGKLEHTGFKMWLDCLGENGEEAQRKAWALMRRYNKRDIVTTEELFRRVQHHVTNLPSILLYREELTEETACPQCGSGWLQRRGYTVAKTRRYPRYHCQECGKWFKGNRSEGGVNAS